MCCTGNLPAKVLLLTFLRAMAWAQVPDELFRQGERLFAEHNPDAAIAAFRRAVELQPGHASAWKALGVVYASRGDFESAEAPFRNACERQPSLPDTCLYYGRTLYLLNRFQPAITVLRRTLQMQRSAEGYRLLALSQEGAGLIAEAADAYREAVRLNHNASPNEDPGIDYGVYLFRLGQADLAIAPLEAALKRHPDAFRANLELGCTLLALDSLAEAAAHLERAVALDPQSADPQSARAHLLLGKVYLRLGRPEAAEEHLRQGSRTVK